MKWVLAWLDRLAHGFAQGIGIFVGLYFSWRLFVWMGVVNPGSF